MKNIKWTFDPNLSNAGILWKFEFRKLVKLKYVNREYFLEDFRDHIKYMCWLLLSPNIFFYLKQSVSASS